MTARRHGGRACDPAPTLSPGYDPAPSHCDWVTPDPSNAAAAARPRGLSASDPGSGSLGRTRERPPGPAQRPPAPKWGQSHESGPWHSGSPAVGPRRQGTVIAGVGVTVTVTDSQFVCDSLAAPGPGRPGPGYGHCRRHVYRDGPAGPGIAATVPPPGPGPGPRRHWQARRSSTTGSGLPAAADGRGSQRH